MDNPAANASENNRRIENLVRAGTITAVDHSAALCRVQSGQLTTDWRPWVSLRAGDVRHWSPPSVGEQCILLSPGGELASAFVLVGLFSTAIAANGNSPTVERSTYPDGAVIEYDHAAHTLAATLPAGGSAHITAPAQVTVHSDSITLDAPQTTTTGALTVQGLLTWQAGMSGSGSTGAVSGAVVAGDIVANGISHISHTHVNVQNGPDSTGAAQ